MANNYNTTLQSNNTNLQAILNTINELPNAGGSDPVLQDKTVTPTTSKQEVTADSNYDGLNKVTVNAMPTATQATPTISINSSTGLITATATQTAGYVAAGTKSATKQLTVQAAQTITPGTSNKTIASGKYLTGTQTIKGDSNLVAGNIKSGVSIFGVAGAYTGGGGDTDAEDGLVTRQLTSYTNDRVTSIGGHAFYSCTSLTTASFPACTSIDNFAFRSCSSLTTVNFPVCTSIGGYAFGDCRSLTTASFLVCTSIGGSAFSKCYNLSQLTLGASRVCTLVNSNAFSSTPFAGYSASFSGTPVIYVTASLVNAYKTATNWTYFSKYIQAIK